MRIYCSSTGQEAYKVKDRTSKKEQYDCYLPDRPNNEKVHAISFDDITDAAIFLIKNKDSGIRMNPNGSIINKNIVIEIDG